MCGLFSSYSEQGLLFAVVCELLIAVLPLLQNTGSGCTGLSSHGPWAQLQQCTGLIALWHVGFSQTKDQTSDPCMQGGLLTTDHQRSPFQSFVCLPWMIFSWSTEMIMWFRPFFLLIRCVTLGFLDVKPILYLLLYFFYMNYKMSFWNFTKFKLIFKLRYLNKHLYGIQTTYPRIWHAFLFPHVFSWVFVF